MQGPQRVEPRLSRLADQEPHRSRGESNSRAECAMEARGIMANEYGNTNLGKQAMFL